MRFPDDLGGGVADYPGTVEGWRLWIARRHVIRYFDNSWGVRRKKTGPYLLRSVTCDDFWRPRQAKVADCTQTLGFLFELTHSGGDHNAPDPKCKCGLYAVDSLTRLLEVYDTWSKLGSRLEIERYPAVVGRVKMWGKVIPGEHGWRAQYAYPAELFIVKSVIGNLVNRHLPLYEDLQNYGVPVDFITPTEMMGHIDLRRADKAEVAEEPRRA
ncbi:MAG: hypothetical protein H0V77_04975 [Actinobacteria bacterium]|nr:hypothetical protein [Actinomycetota bacterium]